MARKKLDEQAKEILNRKIWQEIIDDNGEMIHRFTDNDFGCFVSTGLQAGNNKLMFYVGRIVQIRLEAGVYGSNLVLIRHADGTLLRHENQHFFRVREKYLPELEKIYSDIVDEVNEEYTIMGKNPKTGFIIPSFFKEGEYTPMRAVKSAIYEKLFGSN